MSDSAVALCIMERDGRPANCDALQVVMAVFNSTTPGNDSSSVPRARLTEQVVESILAIYVMPIIIAVGTVGNVTSLVVLLRRRMRRTSVYLYLTVLALADVSVLYVSAFKTWIRLVRKHMNRTQLNSSSELLNTRIPIEVGAQNLSSGHCFQM